MNRLSAVDSLEHQRSCLCCRSNIEHPSLAGCDIVHTSLANSSIENPSLSGRDISHTSLANNSICKISQPLCRRLEGNSVRSSASTIEVSGVTKQEAKFLGFNNFRFNLYKSSNNSTS